MADDAEQRPRSRWTNATVQAAAAVAAVVVSAVGLFMTMGSNDDGQDPAAVPTPDSGTYYFVYGTTMPGHVRHSLIEEFVVEATPSQTPGRLFDTGAGYPAAKFGASGGETIQGYLLRIRPERVFEAERTFTEIEAGLYQEVQVETDAGVSASAFEWIGSTDGMDAIDSGVWDRDEG